MSPDDEGMVLDSCNPLISAGKDPRQFRRFATRQHAGVRAVGMGTRSGADAASSEQDAGACFHAATVRDLSMTGLYFVSKIPYRVGLIVEAQLPMPPDLVTITGVVHRAVALSHSVGDSAGGLYGCGVDFLQSQMDISVRRALMGFLVQLAPHELHPLLPARPRPPQAGIRPGSLPHLRLHQSA